jgi:hypothetical protein
MTPHQYRRMRVQRTQETTALAAFLKAGPHPAPAPGEPPLDQAEDAALKVALAGLGRLGRPPSNEYRCLSRGRELSCARSLVVEAPAGG